MIPIVMSGGSGTRLWPVSRSQFPKQFCQLLDESLMNKTLRRLKKLGSPWVITTDKLKTLTERSMRELDIPLRQIVYEPSGRNTAPAIALICRYLQNKGFGSEIAGIFPADHLVEKDTQFQQVLDVAVRTAEQGQVVTLGLKPSFPSTGYGYLEITDEECIQQEGMSSYLGRAFHEKPDAQSAAKYCNDSHFYWNAGIFVFQIDTMAALIEKHLPAIWKGLSQFDGKKEEFARSYASLESISIDHGVMEKLDSFACVPCDIGWSDLGSWDEMAKLEHKKNYHLLSLDSRGSAVHPLTDTKMYALVGIEDVIIVDTQDALLAIKRGHGQRVKEVVDKLKELPGRLADEHLFEIRPWGSFQVLRDRADFKSKFISVDPGQRLSYQSHSKRSEHWIVIKGEGEVIIDDESHNIKAGDYVHIPMQAKHRIANMGKETLDFVEVQTGSYFGEDDIKRYEDDYKRADS